MNMHPGHWWLAPVYILLLRKESTSEICQEMDGKIFNVKDGIPGDNVPPLHPNCRSTIVPYSKWYEPETRLYRDPQDGKNKYAYNLSFGDWARNIGEPSLVYRADREPTLPTLDGAKFNKYLADKKIVDRTREFLERAKPREGSISKMNGFDANSTVKLGEAEKETARWLLDNIGGSIQYVPTSGITKTPDYKWGRTDLELKTLRTNSINAVTRRINQGSKQIGENGGLLLDFTGSKLIKTDRKLLYEMIQHDMLRYEVVFVIVRKGDKVEKYFARVKK